MIVKCHLRALVGNPGGSAGLGGGDPLIIGGGDPLIMGGGDPLNPGGGDALGPGGPGEAPGAAEAVARELAHRRDAHAAAQLRHVEAVHLPLRARAQQPPVLGRQALGRDVDQRVHVARRLAP